MAERYCDGECSKLTMAGYCLAYEAALAARAAANKKEAEGS